METNRRLFGIHRIPRTLLPSPCWGVFQHVPQAFNTPLSTSSSQISQRPTGGGAIENPSCFLKGSFIYRLVILPQYFQNCHTLIIIFLEARENWKPNRCQVFTRMALARISPLAPSLCCWFIIRVINVSNSSCLAIKFSIKIVMSVFRSCFLDSRMSLESLIQILC